jgi:hypothetical protein
LQRDESIKKLTVLATWQFYTGRRATQVRIAGVEVEENQVVEQR